MNRDGAVRVVAGVLHVAEVRPCQGGPAWHDEDAEAIVDALVAAGWGDLAAERERLAAAVEARCRFNKHEWDRGGSLRDVCPSCGAAARQIRETPEETP